MADTVESTENNPSALGRILLTLALVVVYWLGVVPLGILLRLVGVDLMRKRLGRGSKVNTYRTKSGPGRPERPSPEPSHVHPDARAEGVG